MPITLNRAGQGPQPLVSSTYATNALAAGGITLTAAQNTVLAQLILAVSRTIRRHCCRFFNRINYDGLYTLDQPGATILLRQFPVNAIVRLCTNPTAVLTVTNNDTTTNQRATVQLATAAVADYRDQPPPVTGLTLTRWASGSQIAVSVPFASNLTVQAVANAINALGSSWSATVMSGFALWPSIDLRAVQGAMPALAANAAELLIHVDDLPFTLDAETGEIEIIDSVVDPFSSIRFGPYLSTDVDDLQVYGGRNGVRCVYDAGWDTIPEDVQQAAVETLADWINTLKANQRLTDEAIGDYSYRLNLDSLAIPRTALGKLTYYVNHRS